MGRKRTMNRMAMRTDFETEGEERAEEEEEGADDDEEEDGAEDDDEEAAEEEEGEPAEGGDEDEDGEPKPKKKPKKKAVKAPAKPRARTVKQVRLKVVWGVFSNSNQQQAIYPFPQEAEARAHAERLTGDKKTSHFVQKVKVPMDKE